MADAIEKRTANLETIVKRARDVIATRQKSLDNALLKAKCASDVLSSAGNNTTGALRAMQKVSSTISGEAELKSAKSALLAMEKTLLTDIENIERVQGWLAPFETFTADSLRALDTLTLETLESYLGKPILDSHGMLSPIRNEGRSFSFTKSIKTEPGKDLLAGKEIEDPDANVDGMSVETILSTTFGPLRSAAMILHVGIEYSDHAVAEISRAADIMDSSANQYKKVHDSIEGNDGHAKTAKKTLETLVDRLRLESEAVRKMLNMAEAVTGTVARALESIDAFTVNALRSALYGSVQEEPEHMDVEFTPAPVDLPPAQDGQQGPAEGEKAAEKPKSDLGEMSVTDCISRVAAGETDLALHFLMVFGTKQANEIMDKLESVAYRSDESAGMNAVRALNTIASAQDSVLIDREVKGDALYKLQMISQADLGNVSSQATAFMATLGARES
jgi:hypothetical protein